MTITADRPAPSGTGTDFSAARRAMIDSQLRPSGVNQDAVLAAMERVPREDHVPAAARSHAYIDRAIPLGGGRALPAPLVHGRLLVEAALTADDDVLLITCGSGYLPALCDGQARSVTAVEAGTVPGRRRGGYSVLIIEGAVEQVPADLTALVAEGGRIVTGLAKHSVTRLAVGRKLGGVIGFQALAEIGMPVLADYAAPQAWSFNG